MSNLTGMDLLIIVITIAILIVLVIYIPRLLVMSAMKKVIKTLKKQEAVNPQNAKTAEQLGIRQGAIWENMFRMRDYRPQALYLLCETEIVLVTMDNRYYLSESQLAVSRFKDIK